MKHLRILTLLTICLSVMNAAIAAVPMRFNYQGKLTTAQSEPLTGNHTMYFSIYSGGSAGVAGSGTKVYEEYAVVSAVEGVVNHSVGTGSGQLPGPLNKEMLSGSNDLYLEVAVDVSNNVILPRTRIDSVPFAIVSADGEKRIPLAQPAGFPIVINAPGSYFFTENIIGVQAQHGISITTSNVTLDLAGFSLMGAKESLDGIIATGQSNIVIRNGFVTGWSGTAVNLANTTRARVKDLAISENGGAGLIAGRSSIIESCNLDANSGNGATADDGSIFEKCTARANVGHGLELLSGVANWCTAYENTDDGIVATSNSVVRNCSVYANADNGIVGNGSIIENCTVEANGNHGIRVTSDNIIRKNLCRHNEDTGISVGGGDNVLEDNNSMNNNIGINLGLAGNFAARNYASGNTTNNWIAIPGNRVLVIQSASAGGFAGNSGGTSPGSTDPWVNYTY